MVKCVNSSLTRFLVISCCAAVFAAVMVSTASAVLLVYEPFDYDVDDQLYDPNTMTGLNGGGGFDGAWNARAGTASNVPAGSNPVVAGSLAHPSAALTTVGNSVVSTGESGNNQPARQLSSYAHDQLAASGTFWFSFLGQRQGAPQDPPAFGDNPYPRGVNVSLFKTDLATDDELVGFGNSSNAEQNTWSIIPDGGGGNREGAYSPAGSLPGNGGPENAGAAPFPFQDTEWVVVRIDQVAGDNNDNIYLWLSPDPTSEPSTANADATILGTDTNGMFDYGDVGAIRPFLGNESSGRPFGVMQYDEIRLGTTYADMSARQVTVPEPASLLLLVLGGLAASFRRVRR